MTTFDVADIKFNFMNSIRTCVYPQQTSHASSISLSTLGGSLSQEVFLFSSSISSYGVYISSTVGSPGGLTLSLVNRSLIVNSATVPGTIGWNIVSYAATELSTSRSSSIVITGSVDVSNDYFIGKDSIGSYYYSTLATLAVAFTVGVKDFVYRVYPLTEFSKDNFPVISVDVFGRPRVDNRYLSGDYSWFDITVRADIYSKYTQELDKLAYGIDRGIFKCRKDFMSTYFITPAAMSQISYVQPEVFTRYLTWTLKQLIARV